MHRGLVILLGPSEPGCVCVRVRAGECALCRVSPVGLMSRLGGSRIPRSPWGVLSPWFSDEKPGTDHARLDAPRSGATPAPGRFLRGPSTTLFSRGGHKVPGNVETSSKPQRDSAAAAGDRHGAHRSATPRARSRRLSSAPCPLSPEKRRPASVSSDGAWRCRSSARAAWGPGRATSASLIGGPRSLRRARV